MTGCILVVIFLLCCFLRSKLKKREKKDGVGIPQTQRNQSALDYEILDEIRRDIEEEKPQPEVVITDLSLIMPRLSPRSGSVLSSTSSSPESLPSSRASTARLLVTPRPISSSPLGSDWRQMWDSSGNWSSYADDRAFWNTRNSQPADNSYSSVDWIIKDIMSSYPSLDRVNREQALRQIKLDLTSALLELKTTKLRGDCNIIAQQELENIEFIKKQFIANIEQFLMDFKHELGDDDIISWKNEMDDISVKVKSAQDDIRKHSEILDYQSMMMDPKAKKLETILEMCQEIDNANGNEEVTIPDDAEELKTFDNQTESRSSPVLGDSLPRLEEPRKEERRGKTVVSYSVQKQVTQTMTVTQE